MEAVITARNKIFFQENGLMTAAEFKVMREALGLSKKWLEHKNRYGAAQIRNWESRKRDVPNSIAHYLFELEEKFNTCLEADFLNYKNRFKNGNLAKKVVLLHFRRDIDLWSFRPELAGFSVATYSHISTHKTKIN